MDVMNYGPSLTAEAFLEIDFGERIKAELDEGRVAPLVRGPSKRVRAATSLLCIIGEATRGTGLRTYESLLMVKTGPRSVRFPDVAVYAKEQEPVASEGDRDLMANPVVAAHVRTMDASEVGRLIAEYQAIASMQSILLVDYESEQVRLIQRSSTGAWVDERVTEGGEAVLSFLNLAITHAEVFARD